MNPFELSWTPLPKGFEPFNPNRNLKAFQAELQNASMFYKNIEFHLSKESLDSGEESLSDTCSTSEMNSHITEPQSKEVALYKTEMCTSFAKMGTCPYFEKCKFAHGQHELKAKQRHPKYKSVPCRNFQLGTCRYGDRCCFLHMY
ncbi:hypothetical protein L0F63_001187 [Massospora cicadina]|nr:hypothetical protein L0F63_001187 [Massospora cicadina]